MGNGLAIGSIPNAIEVQNSDGSLVQEIMTSNDGSNRLTPLLFVVIDPMRPHACIFGYNGGRHTAIKGDIQFFRAE